MSSCQKPSATNSDKQRTHTSHKKEDTTAAFKTREPGAAFVLLIMPANPDLMNTVSKS
jgi:hypothetical protein